MTACKIQNARRADILAVLLRPSVAYDF